MGTGNGIFWSEIGSGFGDAGDTPPPKIPRSTPPGNYRTLCHEMTIFSRLFKTQYFLQLLHFMVINLSITVTSYPSVADSTC